MVEDMVLFRYWLVVRLKKRLKDPDAIAEREPKELEEDDVRVFAKARNGVWT